jgi:hypothetical protein
MDEPMRSISMSTRFTVTCAIAALALCAAATAGAQPPEKPDQKPADERPAGNLDLTMTLLPEHAKGPEEITRRIELPPPKASGEHGQDDGSHKENAGQPSDPGEEGRSTAEKARELGREFGQSAAENARENRDNAAHGGNGNGGGNGGGQGPPSSPPGHP